MNKSKHNVNVESVKWRVFLSSLVKNYINLQYPYQTEYYKPLITEIVFYD